jgi:hypothetical protein
MTGDQLLEALRGRANRRGLVIVRGAVLETALTASPAELRDTLASLERSKHLRVLSPLPYLVVALPPRMWPSADNKAASSWPIPGRLPSRGYSYSFQEHLNNQSKAIAIEDGGAGEGGDLLAEILATLGESDPKPFRGVLQYFSPAKIRAALVRVRATRPEKLRKSRTALFRYLLARSK